MAAFSGLLTRIFYCYLTIGFLSTPSVLLTGQILFFSHPQLKTHCARGGDWEISRSGVAIFLVHGKKEEKIKNKK